MVNYQVTLINSFTHFLGTVSATELYQIWNESSEMISNLETVASENRLTSCAETAADAPATRIGIRQSYQKDISCGSRSSSHVFAQQKTQFEKRTEPMYYKYA